jgi:hypothetical protein
VAKVKSSSAPRPSSRRADTIKLQKMLQARKVRGGKPFCVFAPAVLEKKLP